MLQGFDPEAVGAFAIQSLLADGCVHLFVPPVLWRTHTTTIWFTLGFNVEIKVMHKYVLQKKKSTQIEIILESYVVTNLPDDFITGGQ